MKLFVTLLVATSTMAAGPVAPKTVAVALGDCRTPELVTGVTSFHDALGRSWKNELYDPEVALALLRPRAAVSLEAARRKIETARTVLYANDSNAPVALELLKQVIAELERVSPQLKPWPTVVDALLLQSVAFKLVDKKAEAEALRKILRVEPTFTVDKNEWAPSTQEAVVALAKEQQRARKFSLQVTTTPGAEVFIEGRSMGRSPLKTELVAGTYRVSVLLGDQLSFPHLVTVPTSLQVDLAFEGALSETVPLCLSSTAPPDETMALKLGNALLAEKIVIFWKELADGPPFYRAMLIKQGVKEREGGVQVGADARASLDALASFVVTGQGDGVVDPNAQLVDVPAAVPPPPVMVLEPSPVEPLAPMLVSPEETAASRARIARIVGFSALGAGVVTAAVGAVVFALGGTDRERLATLTKSGALPPVNSPAYSEALGLIPKVEDNQALSFTLLGVGGGVAVGGAVTLLLFRDSPKPQSTVTVWPTRDGASVGMSGVF